MTSDDSVSVVTLGCRLNIAESEAIRQMLSARHAGRGSNRPVVVINSCAVTAEAVRQTRQAVRRSRRDAPDAQLVVTGCAAQLDPASFAAMPEVDLVLGNAEKHRPAMFDLADDGARAHTNALDQAGNEHLRAASAFAQHSRGFVAVQTGCDHRCSFCTIPFARGPSRSLPAGGVIDAAQRLLDDGAREIVLTGVDVTSYGHDLPGAPTLGHLVERLLKHCPGLQRLRLSSVDGVEIDDRLFDLIAGEARLMPHLHLSLQSGNDLILKRMKRRHNRSQAIDLVARLKAQRSDIAIGADLIAGFPTEDATMHADNMSILAECAVVHAHIFPYSQRLGTAAARMPQLDAALIKARAAELRAEAERLSDAWLASLVGQSQRVLAERGGKGHAENFAVARLPSTVKAGDIVNFMPTGVEGGMLEGDIMA